MVVLEEPRYSRDYLDLDVRSISNRIQVYFRDGTTTEAVEVEFPLGHRRRRSSAIGPLKDKFRENTATHFDRSRVESLMQWFDDGGGLAEMRVSEFMDRFADL